MKNSPIVCVGGSAGGLGAYIRLLKNLPTDMGCIDYVLSPENIAKEIVRIGRAEISVVWSDQ